MALRMRMRSTFGRKMSWLVQVTVTAILIASAFPATSAQQPSLIAGAGAWIDGGRVSTLEMVGLNPQPEPPSRPALVVYTSGAHVVVITLSCAATPSPRTFVGTGRGTDARWYQLFVADRGLPDPTGRGADIVGVNSLAFPPSPCSDPGLGTTIAGDFIVR